MTKAEQEAKERHEAWEEEQEKLGHSVHLPRAEESEKPATPPKKKAEK